MRRRQLLCSASLFAAVALCASGQETSNAPTETRGLPARATPADYAAHTKVGKFTVAAEFTGHSFPTMEGPLTSEEYIGAEVAFFGESGAKLPLSVADFSLKINGKKVLPGEPYGVLLSSLRDPEWIPPDQPTTKSSKTSLGTGGQGESNSPPPPVKIPVPVQRAMAKRLLQSTLSEGDRTLPQAGLIYFQYRGKLSNLQSLELIYDGPAGKASLKLEP